MIAAYWLLKKKLTVVYGDGKIIAWAKHSDRLAPDAGPT
jgi:hypothetical protein